MSKIDCHTYLASTPFSDNMTDRRRIAESMEKFDLEALVLVSSLGIECDMLNGNKQLRAIVNADAGIYAYVTVNSEYTEQSIEQQRTYLTRPEFVGAVFVSPIGRSLHLDDVYEIANAQRRYGKPLVFRARNAEDIDGIRGIAQEFSKIPIIILVERKRRLAIVGRSRQKVRQHSPGNLRQFGCRQDLPRLLVHCRSPSPLRKRSADRRAELVRKPGRRVEGSDNNRSQPNIPTEREYAAPYQ